MMENKGRAHRKGGGFGRLIVPGLIALLLLGTAGASWTAPKRVSTARAGDCAVCHGVEKVLPQGHEATKAMNFEACLGCHAKGGAQRLEGKLPGSHLHQLSGVTCIKCHGKAKKPKEVAMEQCLTCHNVDKLVEKTAKVKPENPHTSPHYGNSLDCNLCHHQHTKSENYCGQCHKFDFVVP